MNLSRSFFTHICSTIRNEWKSVLVVVLASSLQAFAVRYFTIHYRFPDLGVSGIAVLSNYLVIWAWRDLNVKFLVLTLTAVLTFSSMLSVFALYPLPLPDDKFMATVITGLMLKVGGSSGGTDIIAVALRRRYGIEVGKFSMFVNFFILALSIGVVGLEAVVYGAVGLYVNGVTTDNVTHSFDKRKQAIIITNIPDEVSRFINEHGRGVTRLEGKGGYTGQPRTVLLTLLDPRQVLILKHFLKYKDEHAFVSICDASEVLGKGFKAWRSL